MKRQMGKRLLSVLLALVLCVQVFPGPALAYLAEETGSLTLTDTDGREITVDESWEEEFPYGTFAFQNSEMKIKEGGEAGVLQVYRLGGTTGRAVAYIQYVPAFAQISADEVTYANAAGYGDVRIEVEDPLPIAEYQAIGKAPGPFAPADPVGITVDAPEAPETAEAPEDGETPEDAAADAPETPDAGETAEEEADYTLTVNTQADAY